MTEFLERLNNAYEAEKEITTCTNRAELDKFDKAYREDILFRVTYNSLVEYRHSTGKYNRKGWDDIDRYEPITDNERLAVYNAIINFGK